MNTLTKRYITKLPEHTSDLRELQWCVENWQRSYAEAGSQKERAWRLYGEAIENGESHEMIEQRYVAGVMYEAICQETRRKWEKAKAHLLALLN